MKGTSVVERAATDPDVVAVLLFGSTARDGAGRDVDLALVLKDRPARDALEIRLDHLAVAEDGVDVQVFQALPLHVRIRVLKDARGLLVKDEDALYRAAFATTRAWEDFRPFAEAYLEGAGRA